MISPFSKKFSDKNPLRNVKEPAKSVEKEEPKETPMSESEQKLMHATQSKTDKAIREQEYPGKVGVIIGEGAPKMSPLDQGGYRGGGDINSYYVPMAGIYQNFMNSISKNMAEIYKYKDYKGNTKEGFLTDEEAKKKYGSK